LNRQGRSRRRRALWARFAHLAPDHAFRPQPWPGADEHIRLFAQLDQEGLGSRVALLFLPPLPGLPLALDTLQRLGGGREFGGLAVTKIGADGAAVLPHIAIEIAFVAAMLPSFSPQRISLAGAPFSQPIP